MLNLLDVKPGAMLQLRDAATAVVTENMNDGMWLMVRYVSMPTHPQDVGKEELCHAQDIVKVIEDAPESG